MRLFTGIDLPDDVREKLERLLMHLRAVRAFEMEPGVQPACDAQVHWRMAGGETAAAGRPRSERLLARDPIAAEVKGLGWFPNPHHPRVFWAGVQGGDALPALVKDIDAALAPLGIANGGSGVQCASDAGAHQGAGAVAGPAERDRGA